MKLLYGLLGVVLGVAASMPWAGDQIEAAQTAGRVAGYCNGIADGWTLAYAVHGVELTDEDATANVTWCYDTLLPDPTNPAWFFTGWLGP